MELDFIVWAKQKIGDTVIVSKIAYGDQSQVYQLSIPGENYFIKIGSGLEKEKVRLEWLNGKLPVPKVIDFTQIGDKDALLLSAIEGKNLAELSKEWPKDKLTVKMAKVLRHFHSTNTENCPFGDQSKNNILIHGDACLPNFIFKDEEFSGYIDLGDMGVGSYEVDLSASIWSLQYNLGPGYGAQFLKEYGDENTSEERVEKLRLQYEDVQKEWGLRV